MNSMKETIKQAKETIKQERIAAYPFVLALFPSATDMARELSLDNRASVGQWPKRGVPIEYIMLLDILGLVNKDELIPSVKNWDTYLTKYEQVLRNKLNKVILIDSLKKTASSTLQSVLEPTVQDMVKRALVDQGVIDINEEKTEPDDLL